MTTVAVIGIGDMGVEMIPFLVQAEYDVVAYDVLDTRRELGRERGAKIAESPADAAAQADIVITAVMNDDVPEAHTGKDGVFAGAKPGTHVIVTSTSNPQTNQALRDAAPEGVTVVDAPYAGGVRFIQQASVTFFVGADEAALEAVAPVLNTLGSYRHVGDFGMGVKMKLVTNSAIMAAEAGLREALDVADMFGIPYEQALELIAVGPMQAVVNRALDVDNPRPLLRSAQDDDTLVAAFDDPAKQIPMGQAGRDRL